MKSSKRLFSSADKPETRKTTKRETPELLAFHLLCGSVNKRPDNRKFECHVASSERNTTFRLNHVNRLNLDSNLCFSATFNCWAVLSECFCVSVFDLKKTSVFYFSLNNMNIEK